MEVPANTLDRYEIETTVREVVDSILGKTTFLHAKVDGWIAKIMETCLKRLATSAKQYKYVVSCQIMQNAGESAPSKRQSLRFLRLGRAHKPIPLQLASFLHPPSSFPELRACEGLRPPSPLPFPKKERSTHNCFLRAASGL